MLQTCFGIYAVLALFTFLMFLGSFLDAQQPDNRKSSK